MKNQISVSHFNFQFSGYGHYKVTYTSPTTGKSFTRTTDNMKLIDATKNADNPKVKDMNLLKSFCKDN